MIQTQLPSLGDATLLHRVTGSVDVPQAEQGAADALRLVQQLAQQHHTIKLLLDLRGLHFDSLQAHKAWKLGFVEHPLVHQHVRYVAIIGDDTPPFHAERELMETEQVKFFVDLALGQRWLAQALLDNS